MVGNASGRNCGGKRVQAVICPIVVSVQDGEAGANGATMREFFDSSTAGPFSFYVMR
jgi:hypothetical protein